MKLKNNLQNKDYIGNYSHQIQKPHYLKIKLKSII